MSGGVVQTRLDGGAPMPVPTSYRDTAIELTRMARNYAAGLFMDRMLRSGIPQDSARKVFDIMRSAQRASEANRAKGKDEIAAEVVEPGLMGLDTKLYQKVFELTGGADQFR